MPSENAFLESILGAYVPWLYLDSVYWTIFGVIGNGMFAARFIVQWLHSEREKRLLVPPIFWHISFWASLMNLVYGLHIDKLPIILGTVFLPFLYGRNLLLLRRSSAA